MFLSFRLHNVLPLLLCAIAGPTATFAQGGPPGGAVTDFLVADEARGLVYAAADSGVFRSDDGGLSWTAFSDGLPFLRVTRIVGRPNQLFVSLDGDGVYRSRDGGAWEQVSDGIGDLQVLSLANDPNNAQILFAGTRSDGVFFSNNGGDGWIRAGAGLTQGAYLTLAIAPNDSTRIFAGNDSGFFFESTDGGQAWTPVGAGVRASFSQVRFDPSDPDVVYVVTTGGLFRRPSAGAPFEGFANLGPLTMLDVAVDPADSQRIAVATLQIGLLVSADGGTTWTAGGRGLPRTFVISLATLAETPTRLLGGLGGSGVFASTDGGTNWSFSARGMNGATVTSLAVDPRSADTILAGTQGGGMFRSSNGGDIWVESREGLRQFEASELAFDPSGSGVVYAGSVNPLNPTRDGAVSRSDDGGATWTSIFAGQPFFSLAAHPTDGQTLWMGSINDPFQGSLDPLLLTRNRGASFLGVAGGDGILALLGDVRHVAVDPENPRNVYVATASAFRGWNFLWSDDEGSEFRVSAVFPSVGAVTVDPTDPRRVFVGSTPLSASGQIINGSIFRSDDRGRNFTESRSGLPDNELASVTSIVVDPLDGTIYASTGTSVFRSDDSGRNWTRADDGVGGLAIRTLALDPSRSGAVYAATSGTGVYRTLDRGLTWTAARAVDLAFTPEGVVGAADFLGGGVAPGGIVSIFGVGIGPTTGVLASLDSSGKLPTELAGVRVFFDDIPAPLFFVRSDQVNCQIPFEVAGSSFVQVRIEFAGNSATVTVRGVETRPGVFNAALNQDFSVNTAETPAAPGSVVQLFVTGQGLVGDPGVMTGQIAPSAPPFPAPLQATVVTIDGVNAQLQFVGLAPGFVGLLQINVFVPAGTAAGPRNVVVRIGQQVSPKAGVIHISE